MKGIRIRPEESGLRSSLFDFEAEIMELVWSRELECFSVGDMQELIEERRDVAYTTVMTTLTRLCEKELLQREKDGRKYLYCATMTRDEFVREMTREVINSLPEMGQDEAIALLVERVSESDADELDALEKLIDQQRERLE
jgi:predicted transcriptional regulator